MKKIVLIFFLMLSARVLGTPGQTFMLTWDIPVNQRLEMVRTAEVDYRIDNRYLKKYGERNIINLTCYEKDGIMSRVRGEFNVYQRSLDDQVFQLRESYSTDFAIAPNGLFDVPAVNYMPNLRNIPTFPDKPVGIGDEWKENGELVLNNFSRPFKLIFDVDYRLVSVYDEKGDTIAVINYRYIIDKTLHGGGYPQDFPLKIEGKNDGTIYWNVTKKQPWEINDKYRIIFVTRAGRVAIGSHDFSMNMKTKNKIYDIVTEEENEQLRKELEEDVPSGIDVDTDDRGIVLRMGDVLFDFDSYQLKPETVEKLSSIAEIIQKKYPDREIIVEGHTDSVGNSPYNERLSENRARGVAEYLKDGVGHDKFSYRGYGSQRPRADNSTPEGRQQNRRVDIIIKLN